MPQPEQPFSQTPVAGIALAALVALFAVLQIWIFRWGVITPDTVEQYRQALTGQYQDWHPPITAWLWRMLLHIHGGSAPLLVLDCALYWLGLGLTAEALRRRGQLPLGLGVIAVGLLPIPFGQMGSILKDSLLSGCLIAATGILAFHHLLDRRIGWQAVMGIAVLLVVAAATRFNAVFAVAPLALHALRRHIWQKSARVILPGLLATALLLAGASHVVNTLLLRPAATRPLLSLINFDLAGISWWSGGNAYPMPVRSPPQLIAQCYTPAIFSPHDSANCNAIADDLAQWLKASGTAPGVAWGRAVAADPLAYIRHRATHFNINQRWAVGHVPDDAIYIMNTPSNGLGLFFHKSPAAMGVYRGATFMAASPLGRPATWLGVAAAILVLGSTMRAHPLARAIAASAMHYSGAYAIVSVAPDMRYNSWPMIAVPLCLIVTLANGGLRRIPRLNGIVAVSIIGIAIGGEILAMILA